MIKTIPGETFKDCTSHDFSHYFSGTTMVYSLKGSNKKRAYHVRGLEGNTASGTSRVVGDYLTRDRMWKPASIPFKDWWEHLSAIPPYAVYFNTGMAAGALHPNLFKNLKKSVPAAGGNFITYGKTDPGDVSLQALTFEAFRDLYDYTMPLPYLWEALKDEVRSGTACRGGLIYDRHRRLVFFRGRKVGKVEEGVVKVPKNMGIVAKYLSGHGVNVAVTEEVTPASPPMPHFKTKSEKQWWLHAMENDFPTDIVVAANQGVVPPSLWEMYQYELKKQEIAAQIHAGNGPAYTPNQWFTFATPTGQTIYASNTPQPAAQNLAQAAQALQNAGLHNNAALQQAQAQANPALHVDHTEELWNAQATVHFGDNEF